MVPLFWVRELEKLLDPWVRVFLLGYKDVLATKGYSFLQYLYFDNENTPYMNP